MESRRVTPAPKLGTLARTFNKILRLHRSATSSANDPGIAPGKDDYSIHKLKLSQFFSEHSAILSEAGDDIQKIKHEKQQREKLPLKEIQVMEYFLANLFASISAVKAAYAQLQMAQAPYDPDAIQSSDLAIVAELKRASQLKQSYIKDHSIIPFSAWDSHSAATALIKEQRNLIKTYQITTSKLEVDLEHKDSEMSSLQFELDELEKKSQALELKLHPGRSLSALDGLHPSGLNPTHFLLVLRLTYKSIQSFVKLLERGMESAGWDLDAAAGAIQPDVLCLNKPAHRAFAFQSYVCQKMFSDFHHKSYDLSALKDRSAWGWREFFDEFIRSRYSEQRPKTPSQNSAMSEFLKAKYLALVHPKMETSFFGNLNQRSMVSAGQGFPDSTFFTAFTEMARRVWLLHCLFFSFEEEPDRSIFQVRRGSRFSEVYTESVVQEDGDRLRSALVGFTVVPGFRVGSTLIQCKVYLSSEGNPRS